MPRKIQVTPRKFEQKAPATKKRVALQFKAEPGCAVFVAGSFNNWDPKKNKLVEKDGVYSTTLQLDKGRYEYKFVVNETWCIDPECPEWAPNGLGSLNSVLNVG